MHHCLRNRVHGYYLVPFNTYNAAVIKAIQDQFFYAASRPTTSSELPSEPLSKPFEPSSEPHKSKRRKDDVARTTYSDHLPRRNDDRRDERRNDDYDQTTSYAADQTL